MTVSRHSGCIDTATGEHVDNVYNMPGSCFIFLPASSGVLEYTLLFQDVQMASSAFAVAPKCLTRTRRTPKTPTAAIETIIVNSPMASFFVRIPRLLNGI